MGAEDACAISGGIVRRERRAYYCEDPKTKVMHRRVFLLPEEEIPRCETHGKLQRQANNRYMGKAVA